MKKYFDIDNVTHIAGLAIVSAFVLGVGIDVKIATIIAPGAAGLISALLMSIAKW